MMDGARQNWRAIQVRLAGLNLPAIVFLAVCPLIIAVNLPGHLSYDSTLQLLDGRTGRYHTWHPPFMAWLLGLGDHLVRGAALYIGFQTTLLFASLLALVAQVRRRGVFGAICTIVFCVCPLVLVWQGIVWKDVLFADFTVAGFVAVFVAARTGASVRGRWAFSGLGVLLLACAALVRQNGILALLVGAAAIGVVVYTSEAGPRLRRRLMGLGAGVSAATVGAGVVFLVSQALLLSAVDASGPQAQIHMLQTYDVVGAVAHDASMPLDQLSAPTAHLIRKAAAERYTPATNSPLLGNAFDRAAGEDADAIEDQWKVIVLHHPLPWLEHRLQVFWWMVMTPSLETCPAEMTGVDGPAGPLKTLGIRTGQNARDLALEAYANAFHRTPIYSHVAYALAGLILMVLMFCAGDAQSVVLGSLLVAVFLFTASFVAIGVACDYRYLYALDLAVMVVGLHAALTLSFDDLRRLIRRGGSPAPARPPSG